MSPLLLGMIWTFAAGGKLFAYQSGVLIVGYSYGYFEARDLVRIGWWLTVVEFAILMVLVPIRLAMWQVRFGGLKTNDPDHKRAKTNRNVAFLIWIPLPILLGFAFLVLAYAP